jgi:hypothetical protein
MEFVLRPYGPDDLDLLHAIDAPEMKVHLGGPEGEERTLARHERYLAGPSGDHVLVVEVCASTIGASTSRWPPDAQAHARGAPPNTW